MALFIVNVSTTLKFAHRIETFLRSTIPRKAKMSEYEAVGGSLKLKGVSDHKIKKKKKKKDKEKESKKMFEQITSNSKTSDTEDKSRFKVDKRTKAEIAFENAREKRQAELIIEKASKTHKERIMEFNRHLDSITEHFDIPKVSWTK